MSAFPRYALLLNGIIKCMYCDARINPCWQRHAAVIPNEATGKIELQQALCCLPKGHSKGCSTRHRQCHHYVLEPKRRLAS